MRRTVSFPVLLVAAVAALALSPTPAHAQWRHGRGVVVVGGGFYDPLFWDPMWDPYYPAFYQGYPYYGFGPYVDDASIRLEVKPKEAQVYVDGYYAGIVDDFNGLFQRLHVEPGDHDLVLYLDGYKSVHEHLAIARNGSYKVKYTMQKLAPGEPNEPKPVPTEPQMGQQPQAQMPPMRRRAGYPPPYPGMPPAQPGGVAAQPGGAPSQPPPAPAATGYGVLSIRVQPADAEILIDGEQWHGPQGDERLLVQLSAGTHHVEIRKKGERSFTTDVMVHGGETLPLNVSLSAGDRQ